MDIFKQPISKYIWSVKYKANSDETVNDTWERVSSFVAHAEKASIRDKVKAAFYQLLSGFKFLPGGRITANADPNKQKVTMLNCFVSSEIQDSLDSIMDVAKESALVQQRGGGIGFVFSNIRPKGETIKSNGAEASGPVSFMDIYNAVCGTIKSAGQRRGAMLGALSIEHPDIEEFISAKDTVSMNGGRLSNFNLSIHVTDKFMKAVESDDFFELKFGGKTYRRIKARDLWNKVMRHTYDVAEPGVQYIDLVKKLDNLYYLPEHNLVGSNPCVIEGTYVLTEKGYKRVEDIKKGEKILTNAAYDFEPVTDIEINKNIMTYRVDFSDGGVQYVTASHQYKVLDRLRHTIKNVRVDQLGTGDDVLIKNKSFDYGKLNNVNMDEFRQGKDFVANNVFDASVIDKLYGKSVDFMLGVLNELIQLHGDLYINKLQLISSYLQIESASYEILRHIRLIFLYFGITPEIKQEYSAFASVNVQYNLVVDGPNLLSVTKLIIEHEDKDKIKDYIQNVVYDVVPESFVTIINIQPHKEATVYDLYCEDSDTWVTEGYVQRGCGEQFLGYNGACNLGSMNLTQYVRGAFGDNPEFDYDGLKQDVATAVRFLDDVIDVTDFPTDKYAERSKSERRIGLGITGLADTFVMMKLPYGDHQETLDFLKKVMKAIRDTAYSASVDLAVEKGACPVVSEQEHRKAYVEGRFVKRLPNDIKEGILKSGIRNAFLLTVAPVGTGSIFANNVSSGLEPIFSDSYVRKIKQTDTEIREETVYDYAYLEWITRFGDTPTPDYWRNTNNLTIQDHLSVMSIIQYYVDNSLSKTINVPSDYSFDDFKDVYMQAWKLGIKGVTTYRPNEKVQSVLEAPAPKEAPKQAPVEQPDPTLKLKREPVLAGKTYKLKSPSDKFSYYVTINDFSNEHRPFEVFINTRSNQQPIYSFISRLLSALFRKERNYDFILNEMENTFVNGEGFWMPGKYVGSIIAGIGHIIRNHIKGVSDKDVVSIKMNTMNKGKSGQSGQFEICPECGAPSLRNESGCKTCLNCGYSACS